MTHEEAVGFLQESGWLQDHDRQIYEQGKRDGIVWHPYPQDKPKESNDVLITKRGIVRIASMHGHIWVIAEDGKCVDDSGITAWAELPKPYEEGAENGRD